MKKQHLLKFRGVSQTLLPSSFIIPNRSLSLSSKLSENPKNQKLRSMASFARRAMSLAQIQSSRVPASIGQRRGLAGAADHHGSTKVDFWKQPTNPGNWKEEHFVLISLSGWGLLFYSGYKLATGGNKEKPVESTQ